jgi:hypothetical protein
MANQFSLLSVRIIDAKITLALRSEAKTEKSETPDLTTFRSSPKNPNPKWPEMDLQITP